MEWPQNILLNVYLSHVSACGNFSILSSLSTLMEINYGTTFTSLTLILRVPFKWRFNYRCIGHVMVCSLPCFLNIKWFYLCIIYLFIYLFFFAAICYGFRGYDKCRMPKHYFQYSQKQISMRYDEVYLFAVTTISATS